MEVNGAKKLNRDISTKLHKLISDMNTNIFCIASFHEIQYGGHPQKIGLAITFEPDELEMQTWCLFNGF